VTYVDSLTLETVKHSPRLAIILDQLQLDLPGIEPLSAEERLQRWLDEQAEDTPEVIMVLMLIEDDDTRQERVNRYLDIERTRKPFESDVGWFIPGGDEAWWLYEEAERAYISGLFLASLLCSHAACERALAGCLLDFQNQLDANWRRWGLTPLATAAKNLQIITADLEARLKDLAERRKVSAHFKPPLQSNSVTMRAWTPRRSEPGDGLGERTAEDIDLEFRDAALQMSLLTEEEFAQGIRRTLQDDALFGMQTVIGLLGGEHGHPFIGRL
jgi:hypothetical protein